MDEDLEQMLQWEELNLNMVYSACMWQFVWQTVSVCVCVCVWLWGMARCCFGTWSQENKRLGSLRPHQLPSTLGQCRENQITCDHKHLPNKWNVVIWGCFWKMTDMQGGLQGPELSQLRAARHEKKRERKSQELWEVRKRVWLFGKTHTLI